jgi:hypothetical protein
MNREKGKDKTRQDKTVEKEDEKLRAEIAWREGRVWREW